MNQAQPKFPFVYIGIASSVVCIRKDSGEIEWSRQLPKSTQLVSLLQELDCVYAVAAGEISCLDARTGEVRWHNPLKGFGRGWAILAGSGQDATGAGAAASAQAAQAASMATMMAATSAAAAAN
jgi:hypothetical protein